MPRLLAILAAFYALTSLHGASPVLTLDNELLPSPAAIGSHTPQFIGATQTLVWTTSHGNREGAKYDLAKHAWEIVVLPRASSEKASHETVVRKAGRTAKAWFDPAPKDPSIQLSLQLSPDAPFLLPIRIEDSRPCGDPDLVLLADGTVFIAWPEHYNQNETALWLRRISPGGSLSVPVLLVVLTDSTIPRLALYQDSNDKPAQLLLAYAIGQGETAQIVTRLLTIAPPTNDPRRNPCHTCPDPDEAARGYGLRGSIVSISNERYTITVKHSAIEGALPAGTTEFKVDPSLLQSSAIGKELFARIEKHGANWWLFAPNWIVRTNP